MELIEERLTERIISAAIAVHKAFGPGFLESVYEEALCVELTFCELLYERQKEIEIYHRAQLVGVHRLDLVVERKVVVELKTVNSIDRIHFAQIKSYLKATSIKVCLLLNFNAPVLQVKRFVL